MSWPQVNQLIIKKLFPPRPSEAHKNDYGHLLVIGGSERYCGAPLFNALAAYKVGVDLVTMVAPRRCADTAALYAPHLITIPLPGKFLQLKHLEIIRDAWAGKTALVIGSGLGREKETIATVQEILAEAKMPVVVDADALAALWRRPDLVREKKFVLTPHQSEFELLTEEFPPTELAERVGLVQKWALELTSTIVLKGAVDVISDGQETVLNKTGNPFMTVGGTGDTLAGILGGLLAQGQEELIAAAGAAFLNGAAGDEAAAALGPSFTAFDLLEYLPQVIMEVLLQ